MASQVRTPLKTVFSGLATLGEAVALGILASFFVAGATGHLSVLVAILTGWR